MKVELRVTLNPVIFTGLRDDCLRFVRIHIEPYTGAFNNIEIRRGYTVFLEHQCNTHDDFCEVRRYEAVDYKKFKRYYDSLQD